MSQSVASYAVPGKVAGGCGCGSQMAAVTEPSHRGCMCCTQTPKRRLKPLKPTIEQLQKAFLTNTLPGTNILAQQFPKFYDGVSYVVTSVPLPGSDIIRSITKKSSTQLANTDGFTYHLGKLLTNIEVIPIFWGSYWRGQNILMERIQEFLAWFLTSEVIDMLGQDYSQPNLNIGYGSLNARATPFMITNDDPMGTIYDSLFQRDMAARVGGWITDPSRGLPPIAPNTQQLYLIYAQHGTAIQSDKYASCAPDQGMGGYHDQWYTVNGSNVSDFYYGLVFSCANFVPSGYTLFDFLCASSSHEICEAITDPVPGTGWTIPDGNIFLEIGDVCEFNTNNQYNWTRKNNFAVQSIWSEGQVTCTTDPLTVLPYSVKNSPSIANFNGSIVVAWTDYNISWFDPIRLAEGQKGFGRIHVMNNSLSGGLKFSSPVILQDKSNPNPEYSIDMPAIAFGAVGNLGNRTYIAWAGTDRNNRLNIMASTDMQNWGYKQELDEFSPYGAALACGRGYLFLAWAGPDKRLAVSRYDGFTWKKALLNEWSANTPSLFFDGSNLFIAFRASNGSNQILVSYSSDLGLTFAKSITVQNQTTDYTPALTQVGGDLVLAWRGMDSIHSINVSRTFVWPGQGFPLDGILSQLGAIVEVYDQQASGSVTLASMNNSAAIAWAGTDSKYQMNLMAIP